MSEDDTFFPPLPHLLHDIQNGCHLAAIFDNAGDEAVSLFDALFFLLNFIGLNQVLGAAEFVSAKGTSMPDFYFGLDALVAENVAALGDGQF